MNKLRLDPDGLRVESFGADAPAADANVAAAQATYDRSCLLSCPLSC